MSWKRVSNWANDRPRLASGASRCTIESKASLPALDAMPTAAPSRHGARHVAQDDRRPARRPTDRQQARR